jgi:LPPG:FO 2-phospho-L-lactate transferase
MVKIAALSGGVGAAKLLSGLIKITREEDLSVIVNTGDDIELFGLYIAPDIDIVMYTLAGIVDEAKGWGRKADTFQCLKNLERFNLETWFNLGDKDFATHIFRTHLLRKGFTLSQVTDKLCDALGLKLKIYPMTDNKFETRIKTNKGVINFEEYLVKNQAKDDVLGVEYYQADNSRAAPGVLNTILKADRVIICPSNPIVSIGTILAVKGVRDALRKTSATVVAVSPIIAGAPIKGPADKLLHGLGFEVSAFGVAKLYSDFLDNYIIDNMDKSQKRRIERLGIKVIVTNTIMRNMEDKVSLSKTVLES